MISGYPKPRVSVLMPVYNGARFLEEAVTSILSQDFEDFELIVVDDGSQDATASMLARCTDPRLVVIRHDVNQGVISARNRAIESARGQYCAIMDSDDISLPERLAQQVQYLDQHAECGVLATKVTIIDEMGKLQGSWHDDYVTETQAQIRCFLAKGNCIAHSSVMIRRELLAKYKYSCPQGVTEDYDLWLRLVADGIRIEKLDECLVHYRLTEGSLTDQSRNRPHEFQQIRSKWHFLKSELKRCHFRTVQFRVAQSLVMDVLRLSVKKVFRSLFGEWPDDNRDRLALQLNRTPLVHFLVRLSGVVGALLPVTNRSGLFFFFPFFHTGGAERVHADIVNCFQGETPWVIFTKKSTSQDFYPLFDKGARLLNLWRFCKYGYPFSIGLAAGFINRHPRPYVFGANSLFYALLLPFLKPHVRCSDLIHAFGGGVEIFTLPAATRLDCRVIINQQTRLDLVAQYREAGLDPALQQNVSLIRNRVSVTSQLPEKQGQEPLRVLFVGRGSAEKRIHLLIRAAQRCRAAGLLVQFRLVGDIAVGDETCCDFLGVITDTDQLAAQYTDAHILVITSSREGFPLTVMEGMAHGCVPVCTAVGGIPEHVRHQENGWLLPAGDDNAVVEALYEAVMTLESDRPMLRRLAAAAYSYARQQFCGEWFCQQYRQVIKGT